MKHWSTLGLFLLAMIVTALPGHAEAQNVYREGYICKSDHYVRDTLGPLGLMENWMYSEPYCEGDFVDSAHIIYMPDGGGERYNVDPNAMIQDPQVFFTWIEDMKSAVKEQRRLIWRKPEHNSKHIIQIALTPFTGAPQHATTCVIVQEEGGGGNGLVGCENPMDLGTPGTTSTVSDSQCVKLLDGIPEYYDPSTQTIKLQIHNMDGGTYPLDFQWENTCSGDSGAGTFTGDWSEVNIGGVSDTCETVIKFLGGGNGTFSFTYYTE